MKETEDRKKIRGARNCVGNLGVAEGSWRQGGKIGRIKDRRKERKN